MVRYQFQREKSNLGVVLRPVADVKLEVNGNTIEIPMYIDSGADISMIPLRLGRALGFKRSSSDVVYQARGISGSVSYVLREVFLSINKHKFKARIAWALVEDVPILLGRLDIFNRFKVIFNEKQGYVDFEEVD